MGLGKGDKMKHGHLIPVTLSVILSAGCELSFAVSPSAFDADVALPLEGDLPGEPAGDRYKTSGQVAASGGLIHLESVSRIDLIGRDLEPGESPTAVVIQFDSRYIGLPDPYNANRPTYVSVVDSVIGEPETQGTTPCIPGGHCLGLKFEIRPGILQFCENVASGEDWCTPSAIDAIDGFPVPGGGLVPFDVFVPHTVTIQMDFESRLGRLGLSQSSPLGLSQSNLSIDGELAASRDFMLPPLFGIAKSLRVYTSSIHEIMTPVAVYVDQDRYAMQALRVFRRNQSRAMELRPLLDRQLGR